MKKEKAEKNRNIKKKVKVKKIRDEETSKTANEAILSVVYIILIVAIISIMSFLGYGIYEKLTRNIPNPVATIEIQDYGTIKVELYPDQAPNTVTNFIRLANRGYYNEKTFYRTIPEFMIQGGGTTGSENAYLSDILDDGDSETTYCIEGEFLANDYNKNTIQFERGVIGMARADYSSISTSLTSKGYNSASSQFFIMQEDKSSQMNGLYAPFGKVTEGMDIVDTIANVEVVTRDQEATEGVDKPVNPPIITSITVETYGVDYGVPNTVEPFNYYSWLMQSYGYNY